MATNKFSKTIQSIDDYRSCFINPNDSFEIDLESSEEIISNEILNKFEEGLLDLDNLL